MRHPGQVEPHQHELPHVRVRHPGGQRGRSNAGRRISLVFRRAIFLPYYLLHMLCLQFKSSRNINYSLPSLGHDLFCSMWLRYFARNLTSRVCAMQPAAQQTTVINPDEFVDYSLELLVEPVRGANSSTERHNIAAHTTSDDYWWPRPSPVRHVHSSP